MSKISRQESLLDSADNNELTVGDVVAHTRPQTKQQATFQRLVQQIDRQRAQLKEWHAYSERYNQRVGNELLPLFTKLREKRVAMLNLFDVQFHQRNVVRGKQQRAKLCEMILDLAYELLSEQHDEDIVALYDKYSDLGYAEQQERYNELSQSMMEKLFGEHPDDDNANDNMDETFAKSTHNSQEEEKSELGQSSRRRKSAKQVAAEEKRAAAKKEISQSVREVYRKLASSLHPDRTSADLTADEKTALMQRVNQAYDRDDLLELLNIQLEIEQINADYLADLPDERVNRYIQVLREQQAKLKAELALLLEPYRRLVPYYTSKLKPDHVDRAMDTEITQLKTGLQQADADLTALQDAKQLATFIRHYQVNNGPDEFDAMQQALDDILSGFSEPPPSSSRRRRR